MNRDIFIFLGAIAAIGLAGLYVLQHGSSLFVHAPATDRIAYVSTEGGQTDIWTMKPDGTDKRHVTDDAAEDTAPAWSPDAAEIVSSSNREDGRFEVYVCSWNGNYLKRLTTGAGTKDLPGWSPDGKEIIFISSGAAHVLSRFGGDDSQVLPTVEQGSTQFASPVLDVKWSPNHRSLAAVEDSGSGRGVLVLEKFDDPEPKPMAITVAGAADAAWSKEDYKIAVSFIDRRDQDGKRTNGILVTDLSTLDVSQILNMPVDGTGPTNPVWSPDGKRIAFQMWKIVDRRPDKCIGLYVVSSDGGKPKLLARGEAADPTWSPDGKYLAYTMPREDGKRDIWRIGADGRGAVSLTSGDGDNFQPRWSPAPKKH